MAVIMIVPRQVPLLHLIRRVDISPGSVSILLDRNAFAACLSMGPDRIRKDALRIHAPFRLRRRGVETKLVLGNPTKSAPKVCSQTRRKLAKSKPSKTTFRPTPVSCGIPERSLLCSIKSSLMRDFRVRSSLPVARHAAQGSADSKGV